MRFSRVAVSIGMLGLTGCALFGGGPAYDLSGSWSGGVNMEGAGLTGTLAIEQDGREIHGTFSAPSAGLTAEGTGMVTDDGSVQMELRYTAECPGVGRLQGRVSEDASQISGNMEAEDCTGTVTGTFTFRRR